eukprot:TRINITY_DN2650_c0_g1_i1.p1 TRINITY_DN2650_c0_g1~~TRINITY_DN2650_c0_g1_i1.p1  ORF type:complete len:658 (-),score=162.04 TRINITY_DN2650_c0_g1_i1:194-2167(-)
MAPASQSGLLEEEQLYPELTALMMARARGERNKQEQRHLPNSRLPAFASEKKLPGLVQELGLLELAARGLEQRMPAGGSSDLREWMDSLAVLAELREEADQELVAELGTLASQGGSGELLIPPGEVPELPGARQEALAAVQDLAARSATSRTAPWPPMACEAFDEPSPPQTASSTLGTSTSSYAVPTPCRSSGASGGGGSGGSCSTESGGGSGGGGTCGGSAGAESRGASSGSSFRMASELLPPGAPRGPAGGGASPDPVAQKAAAGSSVDFEGVSKSIINRGKRPRQSGGSKEAEESESGRTWSEAWLRIAQPDELERIVPALEATVHRPDSADCSSVRRQDIAGLGFVKTQIEEVLILPRLHPQLFASTLTRPTRGLLLFGPPGTGKTLLARWIAAECGATFFNVNASTVLSKWIGEAEKTVKALFQLAADRQPSVIFIDEIDSLLSQRRDADNESSRRVKNEFLTSLEGADTAALDKILLVGATNMPWELDHAALRRLPKRLYVPLPSMRARCALLRRQLSKHNEGLGLKGGLSSADLEAVAARTEGFSGSDLQQLLREAAMGPVREASAMLRRRSAQGAVAAAANAEMAPRDISMKDFECALQMVKPTFSADQETKHRAFNEEHGTCRGENAMRDADSDEEEEEEKEVGESHM